MFRRFTALLLVLLVAACEPEATPLPVNLPTLPSATTSAPTPNAEALRYALAPGVAAFLSEADQRLISASAELVTLDALPNADDLGTAYNVLVALSDLPESTEAPTPLRVDLRINTALTPLDNPEIALIVNHAVNPQEIARVLGIASAQAGTAPNASPQALRTELANLGYPDGFDLTLAAEVSAGTNTLVGLLEAVNIGVRLVPAGEMAHLRLTSAPSGAQASSDSINLLNLPIHYRAVPGVKVSYTPSGFPVISR